MAADTTNRNHSNFGAAFSCSRHKKVPSYRTIIARCSAVRWTPLSLATLQFAILSSRYKWCAPPSAQAQFTIAEKRGFLNKITALSTELNALTPRYLAVSPSAEMRSVEMGEDGENLNGLKAELSALEAEAEASSNRGGRSGRWYSGRGHRGSRGSRGRGGYGRVSHTLDNRTTIVKVANLPEDARDPIVLTQHFGNFGAVDRVVMDEAAPGQGFIKFQDRFAGQAALIHGNVIANKQLEMGWVECQEAPAELTQSDTSTEAASIVAESDATGSSDHVRFVAVA